MIIKFTKNILNKFWKTFKRFPLTVYGALSFISHLIFSYDYYILALITGAPFMWFVYTIENILFPGYSHLLSTTQVNSSDRILEFLVIMGITILLDIFLHKKIIPIIKRYFSSNK